jgi:hypothetical protein
LSPGGGTFLSKRMVGKVFVVGEAIGAGVGEATGAGTGDRVGTVGGLPYSHPQVE